MSFPVTRLRIMALAIIAAGVAATAASASMGGGGGGGGAPSMSTPRYDAAAEYREGIGALQAQRWADAERSFKHVLAVAPQDANTNYLLGLSKIGRGDYKGARSFLERAVKYDPKMIAAHEQLGVTLAKLGEADKAKVQLDWLKAKAAECNAGCADRTALDQSAAAVQSAIDAGKQARLANPGVLMFASAAAGDGAYLDAVSLINERRYAAAIESLGAAQRVFGPHPDVLTYLGFANRKLHDYGAAEDYYRRALAIAPAHRGATEYYGEMMLERGDLHGATAMLARLEADCAYGCAEADELRRWIARRSSAS